MSFDPVLPLSTTEETIISVRNLSKMYHLYDRPEDRLKQFIYPRLRRLIGKPMPAYFREFWALRDVSFGVRKGETLGIIGRNGSGKSTLLQLIAGTLSPTYGEVRARGRVAALLELGAGFNPEFSGRENIYMNAAILGMSRQEIDNHIEEIIDFADIGEFIDQPVKTYSSGMYVRVAFSTAINVNPDILIVDEALSVGDTAFQQKCLFRIREMQQKGVTILLVTHSNNILLEYCDRGIFLKRGQVVFDGVSKEAVRSYGLDILHEEGGQASTRMFSSLVEPTSQKKSDSGGDSKLPMEIIGVTLTKTDGQAALQVESEELLSVTASVQVRANIPLPVFGIEISTTEGIALWSATTKLMGLELPSLEPGKYNFCWYFRANLLGNRYVIALGVGQIENGEYKRIQRLPYAGHFDVISPACFGLGYASLEPVFSGIESI